MANIISQSAWGKSPDRRDMATSAKKKLYDEYVASTYNQLHTTIPADTIAHRYREFLKKILIYITQTDVENQRFLTNIDFNKKEDISLILPYYVKRLKEIAFYFRNKRHEVSNIKHKVNIDGSTEGFKRFIKRFVLSLLSDKSFISKHKLNTIPPASIIEEHTTIDIQTLYDVTSNYHNQLDSVIEGILFLDTNFKESITKILSKYPIYVIDKNSGKYIYTSNNRRIKVKIKRDNYEQLPSRHFVNGQAGMDNLECAYKKQFTENYIGTDHWYLSGNGDTHNFEKLFDAKADYRNIPNQRYPTLAFDDSRRQLKTINQIGGNFKPSKFGITTLHGKNVSYTLNTSHLSAGRILTFPDPGAFGDINYTGAIRWSEDNRWLKADRSNNFIAGDIYDMEGVQKLYPYQTREESLKLNVQGLSRAEDKVDFWIGDNKTVWANSDIYPKTPATGYDITGKQQDLLVTDKTVYEWYGDSYGNEFAIYKETQPTKQTKSQKDGIYTLTPTWADPKYTPNYDLDSDLFQKPLIRLFNHQYSIARTTYTTSVNNLTEEVSLLTKDNLYGQIYFRNAYSSVIGPLNDMMDTLFIKYIHDERIIDELKNNVVDFSVYGNVIVIRTENFLIIEKYILDSKTGVLKAAPTPKIYFGIASHLSQFEQIGKPWYYEEKNQLFVVKTTLHPHLSATNYKSVFPEVTIVNLNNLRLTKAFPGADLVSEDIHVKPYETYKSLAEYNLTLIDTGLSVNLVRFGNPQVSFNRGTKTYAITYTGFDEIGMPYIHSFWLRKRQSTFFTVRSALLQPDKTVFSSNFSNYRDLSGQFISNVKTDNFITTRTWQNRSEYPAGWGQYNNKLPEYNMLDHAYTPDNDAVIFGVQSWHREPESSKYIADIPTGGKPHKLAAIPDNTTYFSLASTVQGGEKITVLADVAFYSWAWPWKLPWGANIFFFDASSENFDGLKLIDNTSDGIPGQYVGDRFEEYEDVMTGHSWAGRTYLSAFGTNQCHPAKTPLVFGVGLDLISERLFVTDHRSQTISPFSYVSAGSAQSGIQKLNTQITNRSDIKFVTIKIELEVVSNKMTVSMKPYGGTTFHEYISLDISEHMTSFPTQLGVGMSIMSTGDDMARFPGGAGWISDRRTTCEMKNFSIFGGKSTPESTMSLTTL